MEMELFKQCAEKPIKMKPTELKLDFVSAAEDKVLRLYQLVWSALTKIVKESVCEGKPIELPFMGLTVGVSKDEWTLLRNPMDKGYAHRTNPYALNTATADLKQIRVQVGADFLQNTGLSVDDRTTFRDCGLHGTLVNFSSIAKVCLTDASTVELMLTEFNCQLLKHLLSEPGDIKLNLRIGQLIVRQKQIQFKQSVLPGLVNKTGLSTIKTPSVYFDQSF